MQLSLGQRAALDHGLMLFNALWAWWVSYLQETIIMPDDIWSNAPSLCNEKNDGVAQVDWASRCCCGCLWWETKGQDTEEAKDNPL